MSQIIDQACTVLARHTDIQVAFVFGSTARGEERSNSDLDIGFATPTPLSVVQTLELMDELATACGRPVDLVDLTTAPVPILRQVLTQGVCILKKDPNLYAFLLRKLWYDQADIMPNYNFILRKRRERFVHG